MIRVLRSVGTHYRRVVEIPSRSNHLEQFLEEAPAPAVPGEEGGAVGVSSGGACERPSSQVSPYVNSWIPASERESAAPPTSDPPLPPPPESVPREDSALDGLPRRRAHGSTDESSSAVGTIPSGHSCPDLLASSPPVRSAVKYRHVDASASHSSPHLRTVNRSSVDSPSARTSESEQSSSEQEDSGGLPAARLARGGPGLFSHAPEVMSRTMVTLGRRRPAPSSSRRSSKPTNSAPRFSMAHMYASLREPEEEFVPPHSVLTPPLPPFPMDEEPLQQSTRAYRKSEKKESGEFHGAARPFSTRAAGGYFGAGRPPMIRVSRDWNSEYQAVVESKDGEERGERLRRLVDEFVEAATFFGEMIIRERHLPEEDKTIRALHGKGVAGGEKYRVGNIFFKFAVNESGLYPSDREAMKIAGHELKGVSALASAGMVLGLCFPLLAVIDYRGFRLMATSMLPIAGDLTLVYGSCDGGRSVVSKDTDIAAKLGHVARVLNLKGHWTGLGDSQAYLVGPCDIEAHRGRDGRAYVVDCARLWPCEGPPQADLPGSFLFRLLRGELVSRYAVPLCSDAYTHFGTHNGEEHARDVREATRLLLDHLIPEFAHSLDLHFEKKSSLLSDAFQSLSIQDSHLNSTFSSPTTISKNLNMNMNMNMNNFNPMTKTSNFSTSMLGNESRTVVNMVEVPVQYPDVLQNSLHRAGINLRHMGRVLQHCRSEGAQTLLLSEICARTLKSLLRAELRGVRSGDEAAYGAAVLAFSDRVFGIDSGCAAFWRGSGLKSPLQHMFPGALTESQNSASCDLRERLDMDALMRRTMALSGVRLAEDGYVSVGLGLPLRPCHYGGLVVSEKHMYAVPRMEADSCAALARKAASSPATAVALYQQAIGRYRQVLRLKSDDLPALRNMGTLLAEMAALLAALGDDSWASAYEAARAPLEVAAAVAPPGQLQAAIALDFANYLMSYAVTLFSSSSSSSSLSNASSSPHASFLMEELPSKSSSSSLPKSSSPTDFVDEKKGWNLFDMAHRKFGEAYAGSSTEETAAAVLFNWGALHRARASELRRAGRIAEAQAALEMACGLYEQCVRRASSSERLRLDATINWGAALLAMAEDAAPDAAGVYSARARGLFHRAGALLSHSSLLHANRSVARDYVDLLMENVATCSQKSYS